SGPGAGKPLAGEERRAEDAGVVAEGRAFDPDLAGRVGQRLGTGRRADQFDPGVAEGLRHTPADDDDLGPEHVDQAAETEAQETGRPADLLGGEVVALGDGLRQVAALEPTRLPGDLLGEDRRDPFADRLGDAPGDRRPARQRLHAATGPAAALRA